MLAGVRFRHQHPDVAPDELRGAIAEDPLGRRVDRPDPAVAVDDDDRVERRLDDGAEQRVAVLGRAGATVVTGASLRSNGRSVGH